MKKIITRFDTQRLKNETHVQFNKNVDLVFIKYDPETLGISALYVIYKEASNEELLALDFIRKSTYTEKIIEQDRQRGIIYRGFFDSIKGATKHFEPSCRVAANSLYNIFSHYGNISRKTLDDETAAINDLIRELNLPIYAQAITLLGLMEWKNKLVEENQTFSTLMTERYVETAGKTAVRMRTARAKTDRYYHAIISQIENQNLAGIAINENFIRELNAVIERFKNILAQETGGRKPKPESGE